jgi:hypothetical protein
MDKISEIPQPEQVEVPRRRETFHPEDWLPEEIGNLGNHQTELPRIAKNAVLTAKIERTLQQIPTWHDVYNSDARHLEFLDSESVHLVLTSPPYWTLKKYRDHPDQLGGITGYTDFLDELDKVWQGCYRALVPGGRLICVVGDVCLSRRKNAGEHTVVRFMPLFKSVAARLVIPTWPRSSGTRSPMLNMRLKETAAVSWASPTNQTRL